MRRITEDLVGNSAAYSHNYDKEILEKSLLAHSLRDLNIVIITKPIDHSLIHHYYHLSHCFVLPSRGEGLFLSF